MIDINQRVEALKKQGIITEYPKRSTQELLLRATDRLAVGFQNIKKKVDEIMSGALARTRADEILEQGLEQGLKQGLEQGQNETAALFGFLLQHERSEDAKKASSNQAYLKELLLKFKSGKLSAN